MNAWPEREIAKRSPNALEAMQTLVASGAREIAQDLERDSD
jgi:hypothetical protein